METAEGLAAAVAGMQDDPEMLAAFAEAQAEMAKKKKKKGRKKKNKQMGEQLAQLEEMMAKLEDGSDLDLQAAQDTLKMLTDDTAETKKSKKKKKKEKLPAPFSEPAKPDDLGDLDDLDELPPELLDELKNYEPTEEEIAAEFERLKAEEDKKKKKKQKKKREQEAAKLVDEDGNLLVDDAGQEMRMDDPALLAELLEAEEDPEMKAYLQKQLKKTIKKEKVGKKKKIKKEKRDRVEIDHFPDEAFADGDDFGWQRKDAEKKMFVPSEGAKESIPETEEEKKLREAREAGEEIAPSDAPVGDADFGPTLPDTGIAPRPDTGAIPGGSKLKPVLDDEVVEQRLRQKALEKAIQERLDKRLMRQKRIEVRLAGWIGKQRALKDEAKQIAEERLLRAQENFMTKIIIF